MNKILNLNINKDSNVYLISDIHANLELLKKILKDINFSHNDYLFILGDIIEKGDYSLDTLSYIRSLILNDYNIYITLGNCDNVINEFVKPVDANKLYYYSKVLGHTILNELFEKLNLDYTNESFDINQNIDKIYLNFKEYFDFINSFYDAIYLNDDILLMHSTIDEAKKKKYIEDDILENIALKKLNICGHMPVQMFKNNFISSKPIIHDNFLHIDGGNNVVLFGGLNLVKLDLNTLNYEYKTYYNYPKYIVLNDFRGKGDTYIPSLIKIDEYQKIGNLVKFKYNDKVLYSKLINNKNYCYDSLNIFLKLNKNDIVYCPFYNEEISIIIKDNIVGLVYTNNLKKME